MAKNEQPLHCRQCRRVFTRPKPTGRIPRYCSDRCRSANYRRRASTPSRPRTYDIHSVRLTRAVLTRAQAMAHRTQHPVPALPLEVLQLCVALRRDLDDTTAVALRQALARGATWKQVAEVMHAAESTLKNQYSVEKVDKILQGRLERGPVRPRQTAAAPKDPRKPPPPPGNRSLPGQPGYPLSCALSYLRRASDTTVAGLAFLTGVSASYIYRITAGERTPTWEVTARFARACETDPEELMFLWNRAHLLEPPAPRGYPEAVRTLRAALRGLRLAAGNPDLPLLMSRAPAALSISAAIALLDGQPVTGSDLRWPAVRDLTIALQGDPETIRPLWQHTESLTPVSVARTAGSPQPPRWPAAAFG